jgi:hypothetical protein
MEQVIKNNLDHWHAQWLAIEHPKNISAIEKYNEYYRWRRLWDFWYFAPNLDMGQAIRAYNEQTKE